MKIKEFFKSTAFKCIMVLLAIALISGGLLSILNDVLYVSDDEKLARVISGLYGGADVAYTEEKIPESLASNKYGTVNKAYTLSDGNLIVNATGINGYKGGTVTVWCVVKMTDGAFDGISSVAIDEYTKQTLMSQFSDSFTLVYSSSSELIKEGYMFSVDEGEGLIQNVNSGATMSSRAINNAVDAVIYYVKEAAQQ